MDTTPRRSLPRPPRIAAWSVAHPWRALAAWVLVVVACLAMGLGLTGVREVDASTGGIGESGRADAQIAAAFDRPYIDEQILIRHADRRRGRAR